MSDIPLPLPGSLGLIQFAGVDMHAYAAAVSAADNAALREALGALMHALDESDLVHDDQRKAFKEAREVLKGANHE